MIKNVKYLNTENQSVSADFNGQIMTVPCVVGNRQWDAIVAAGITPAAYVEPAKSIQEQINELEAQQTPRLMREAFNGELYATNKLTELDAQITALRAQL